MQADLDAGRSKSFYSELLEELKTELQQKQSEREVALAKYQPSNINITQLQIIQDELKKLILLLNDENPSPKQLHQLVGKYVSSIIIQRETKTVHITYHLKHNDVILYQKTIVTDWDLNKH
jgi:site-specific DNA recombinase